MWCEGDVVALRHVHAGRPSHVWPAVVVEDSRELAALYLASGSPTWRRSHLDGSPLDRSLSYEERTGIPWRLAPGTWFGSSCLQLQRAGEPRSWWRWLDGSGWYVNLQDPLRRTPIGFDTSDHVLDLVVSPDGSWRWKDEDEFTAACRRGRFDRREAAAVRRAGEAAAAAIEARAWPFDSEWVEWRPPPLGPLPRLPAGWDEADSHL